MLKPSLLAAVAALIALPAAAQGLGEVTRINRPQVNVFDETGAPAGPISAKDVKLPAPIVAVGKSNSVGIKYKDKVVYLRGLDVETVGLKADCEKVETAAREKGSSYAASNMGLGQACKKKP